MSILKVEDSSGLPTACRAEAYDANGNPATRTDGKGQTTNYEYDSRSRLIQVRYPSGAEVSYTYDAVGNALTMRDGVGTTVCQYDALNRLTAEADPFGRTVRYSYDDAARTGTLSTDWGTITYQSDILGQLETVTDPSGGVTRYHYDLAGGCSQVDYPNGDVITCAYDYTYDTAGNRLTMTNSTGTTGYEYDGNYRLKKATRPGGSYTEYWYDEAGNRNDRLTLVSHPEGTASSYEYDANGNQLRLVEPQGTTVFTYDEENRLTGIGFPTGTSVEYQYDGQGRRLRMKDPNVEVFYQYDGGQVISDRDGAGTVIAYYVRGLGGRLISNVQTAGTRYYHFDGLGSVVALTDSVGAKVSSYTYDEFGVLKQSSGQSWNNFQYTSSIHDTSPGLYLMGSRYYDPALGRFITQDTWGGNAYDPWTRNLYAYGRGNPMSFVDPTGHAATSSYDPNNLEYDLHLIQLKENWQAPMKCGRRLGSGQPLGGV